MTPLSSTFLSEIFFRRLNNCIVIILWAKRSLAVRRFLALVELSNSQGCQ